VSGIISNQLSLFSIAVSVNLLSCGRIHATYISGKERVKRKCATLPLVICTKDDEDIFYGDHNCKSPDDKRDRSKDIVLAWFAAEGAGVNIERTRADVTVDDSEGLVGKPRYTVINMYSSIDSIYMVLCHLPCQFPP